MDAALRNTLQAVFQSGGFMETAAPSETLVIRKGENDKPIPIRIDLAAVMAAGGGTDIQLQPDDIVYVPKSAIANAMADRKATMVFFNTEPDLRKAFQGPLRGATDLNMQDLRANENPAEGDDDYMNHITRDASFEEIWHLVHDNGIKQVLPETSRGHLLVE